MKIIITELEIEVPDTNRYREDTSTFNRTNAVEFVEHHLKIAYSMKRGNPLSSTDMMDCKFRYSELTIIK